MGKTKAEEIRKELNETRGTKEPKVYCRVKVRVEMIASTFPVLGTLFCL